MDQEIKALRAELALLKLQFSERVNDVEHRLNQLLEKQKQSATVEQAQEKFVELDLSDVNEYSLDESEDSVVANEVQATEHSPYLVPSVIDEYFVSVNKSEQSVQTDPSVIILFVQALFSSVFDWFAPLAKIYQSYKDRGMLGIFILTIVGVSLTLAGFGYLMQLLIDQMGAGSKALLMCFAAILVMGIGIGLKIKTRFGEFATAIVTLGILLSYCTVYFSGSVYQLIPDLAILFLYLAMALICHVLALWLDTKVVASLGIIGIATMPMLFNSMQIEPFYYLMSLAFILSSSLILALRYTGHWLANLSLVFTVVSLEWMLGIEESNIAAWIVDLFYLLFFAYIVVSIFKEKVTNKQILIFLAAVVGSTVFMFFQATELLSTQVSVSFVLNALVSAIVTMFFYRTRQELTAFFILLSALWAILAIISAISSTYWGIAWAVEGLLLLVIGRQYLLPSVINQGQVLTAIALLYSWSALLAYFPLPALKSIDGWVLTTVIVMVIAIWQRLINVNCVFNHFTKQKVKPALRLLEVVWLTVLYISNADIWFGNWTGATVIFLQLVLLFRAKYTQQLSIEIFAASLLLVTLFYAYTGVLMVDSVRFMALPLFAKLSVVSAFAQLWLWSAFYRKYYPDSVIKELAEGARILFYMLLPVCWLGSALRQFNENALLVLWCSPLMALFIAQKIKHYLLIQEAKLLTALASLCFMVVVGQLTLLNSLMAIIGFLGFYLITFALNKKAPSSIYQFIISWGIISSGIALPAAVGFQLNNMLTGVFVAALYWVTAFSYLSKSTHIKRNEGFITTINLALVVGGWVLTPTDAKYACLPILFLIACIYQKDLKFNRTFLGYFFKSKSDLFFHSIGVITYLTLFASLTEYRLDLLIAPVLAVHGALLLFVKVRRIITVRYSFGLIVVGIAKLALVDAANALLWQKVILFMGIGVFILVASFGYQKLIERSADISNE